MGIRKCGSDKMGRSEVDSQGAGQPARCNAGWGAGYWRAGGAAVQCGRTATHADVAVREVGADEGDLGGCEVRES